MWKWQKESSDLHIQVLLLTAGPHNSAAKRDKERDVEPFFNREHYTFLPCILQHFKVNDTQQIGQSNGSLYITPEAVSSRGHHSAKGSDLGQENRGSNKR